MKSTCWTPERLSELRELWAIARHLEQSLQNPPLKGFQAQDPSSSLVPALASR